MKKKAIKLATSTAIAATAFVAAAPANQADAAVNVEALVKDAETAAGALKWAISLEGTADGKTRPWAIYNLTKDATAKAKAAVAKTSGSQKVLFQARLQAADVQIDRAQAYIDALTAGEKIKGFQTELEKAISSNNLDAVETNYHNVTREIRKQATLLYRVYGQSTRDLILSNYKAPAERVVNSVKVEVTVKMELDLAAADVKAGKYTEAAKHLAEANALLGQVDQWKTELTKNRDDVVASLPLSITSVSRVNKTTVTVTFSKEVDAVTAAQFSFNNGLGVTDVVLSSDKKSATLTTTPQADGTTYTVSFKGVASASFTTPANNTPSLVNVDGSEVRKELTDQVSFVATFKDADGSPSQLPVNINLPAGFKFVSINGSTPPATNAGKAVLPNSKGEVTVIVSSADGATATQSGKVTFEKLFNGNVVDSKTTGTVYFYKLATDTDDLTSATVSYVNKEDDYFVVNNLKYKYDSNDTFKNENFVISNGINGFEEALNEGDQVTASYQATKANISEFNITFNKVLSDLDFADKYKVIGSETTSGGAYYRVDDNAITLTGKGQPGHVVHVFRLNDNTLLGKTTVSSNGTWELRTNIDQNTTTRFGAVQVPVGVANPTAGAVTDYLNVLEGAYDVSVAGVTGNVVNSNIVGDTYTFTSDTIATITQDVPVISNGAYIVVRDADGTTAKFTNGSTKGTEFTADTTGKKLSIKFGFADSITQDPNITFTNSTLDGPLQVVEVNGVTNQYGLKLKIDPTADVITGY